MGQTATEQGEVMCARVVLRPEGRYKYQVQMDRPEWNLVVDEPPPPGRGGRSQPGAPGGYGGGALPRQQPLVLPGAVPDPSRGVGHGGCRSTAQRARTLADCPDPGAATVV